MSSMDPESKEEEVEQVVIPKFSIPIHALIDANQTSHGLRHDDYKQYHAYCTRRLSRLRHARSVKKDLIHSAQYVVGEKQRRHVYCTRAPPETLHDERFLLVTLVQAERAWAQSNEIKNSSGERRVLTDKPKSSPGKIRQHALRRLKRAMQAANELEEMAIQAADERTIQEAKAYGGWMRGNWSLEIGDWKTACAEYGSAMSICRTLSQASEDTPENLELRDLFTARADNILKPLLRYCQYELGESVEQDDVLDSASTQEPHKSGAGTISFRGHDVTVENKNLRVTLLKAEGLVSDLQQQEDETKFLQLLSTYDDAIAIVTADLKNYESMKSGPAVNAKRLAMSSLLGHFGFEKAKLLMGRNEALVQKLRHSQDSTTKRLEEIAHLYDALLQEARAVCTLPGGESEQEDEFVLEAKANVLRIRALRCYYIGRLYANIHKNAEALTLLKQALMLASRAVEEIAACEDMEHADEYLQDMELLEHDIRGATCRVQAQAYLGSAGTDSSDRSLLERLYDFDAGKQKGSLADVPPALIPMPCKPTFYDVAWNHVGKFPMESLEQHIHENQPQEESKGLLGWFRR